MRIGSIDLIHEQVVITGRDDGTRIELSADDAIDLLFWLLQRRERLLEMIRIEIARRQRSLQGQAEP